MGNKILSYKQVHSTLSCKRKLVTHVYQIKIITVIMKRIKGCTKQFIPLLLQRMCVLACMLLMNQFNNLHSAFTFSSSSACVHKNSLPCGWVFLSQNVSACMCIYMLGWNRRTQGSLAHVQLPLFLFVREFLCRL